MLAGLLNSGMPSGAMLSPPVGVSGGGFDSSLSWSVSQESEWTIVCLQAYHNGTQAYRDVQNRSLPVRSRQVCFDWSAAVDPAPSWLSPSNMSSDVRPVYMGEQISLDLTAQDMNQLDSLSISAQNLP